MVHYIRKKELFNRIRSIIDGSPYNLRDYPGTGGSGAPGRLMEHLLEISPNNISAADAVEYEIKTGTKATNLITLFHKEPQDRNRNFIRDIVHRYGWTPMRGTYPAGTLSFRHTICAVPSERGFYITLDDNKISVMFRPDYVAKKHAGWLAAVNSRCSDGHFAPTPEWSADELSRTSSKKMANCIYVHYKKHAGQVHFTEAKVFHRFLPSRFLAGLCQGDIVIDFDARTSHPRGIRNHGTKFRVRQSFVDRLYEKTETIHTPEQENQ